MTATLQVRLGTYFETVLRIFRWKNQTAGDAYLRSHPPVFYLRGSHGDTTALPAPSYKSRAHPDSVREAALAPDFAAHGSAVLAKVGNALGRDLAAVPAVPFGPLMIQVGVRGRATSLMRLCCGVGRVS